MRKIGLLLLCALGLSAGDIYATFNVKPIQEATLAFTSGGIVESVNVDIGSKVSKGDLLASLDAKEEKKMLDLAVRDAKNADIVAMQNDNSYKRFKAIEDILDDEKFEKIDFAKRIADVNADKAKENVELKKVQLAQMELRAPFKGVITAKYKDVGDAVAGVQPQAFFQIMDMSKVKLVVEFDSKYFSDVKVGDRFIYFVDGIKKEKSGVISKIYPTVNSKTRKISAEVITQNLMPGLFGHGSIKAK